MSPAWVASLIWVGSVNSITLTGKPWALAILAASCKKSLKGPGEAPTRSGASAAKLLALKASVAAKRNFWVKRDGNTVFFLVDSKRRESVATAPAIANDAFRSTICGFRLYRPACACLCSRLLRGVDKAALDEAHRLRIHRGDQRVEAVAVGRGGGVHRRRRAAQDVRFRPVAVACAGQLARAQPAVAVNQQLRAGQLCAVDAGDDGQGLPCLGRARHAIDGRCAGL